MLALNESLLIQVVIFTALWFLLKRFWFEPALRVIKERARRSEGAVAEAEKLQAEAARLRQEHAVALEQARREAQAEVQELLRAAEHEQRRLLGAAIEDAQRALGEVRARVAEEVADARKALRNDVQDIAREIARTVVGRAL
jgi:F-type H+-transporting ATPase subunit b